MSDVPPAMTQLHTSTKSLERSRSLSAMASEHPQHPLSPSRASQASSKASPSAAAPPAADRYLGSCRPCAPPAAPPASASPGSSKPRPSPAKLPSKPHHMLRDLSEKPLPSAGGEPAELSFTRSLMFHGHGTVTDENVAACAMLQEARAFRKHYCGGKGIEGGALGEAGAEGRMPDRYEMKGGVLSLFSSSSVPPPTASSSSSSSSPAPPPASLVSVPTIFEFMSDYNRLVAICNDGATRSFSFTRLQLLSSAFKTHVIANGHVENEAQSRLLGTDFFRTPKVDNHIHLAAAASAKTFVDFVAHKLATEADTVVLEEGDTLGEVFAKAGLDADHLTIDAFNVLADYSVYQRFDNFNSKYSPFKLAQMRRIFLKVDNAIKGRYFAELTKRVLSRHEASKGHESLTEMRLSV
ncbi:hypothetical protein TeGR_g10379, partial [Tetraparma gracilis]